MRNLARLTAGARNQIRRCLDGKENCLICLGRGKNVPSAIAVSSYNGWYPACKEHGEQAEKLGWEIVRSVDQETRKD